MLSWFVMLVATGRSLGGDKTVRRIENGIGIPSYIISGDCRRINWSTRENLLNPVVKKSPHKRAFFGFSLSIICELPVITCCCPG